MQSPTAVRVSIVLLLVSLSACSSAATPKAEEERVRLATFPSAGRNAPYHLGASDGTLAAAGFALELVPSFGSTLALLEAGEADIAQALCSDALRVVDEGSGVRIIGARDAVLPVGTVSLPEKEIDDPSDYAGKTWGESADNDAELALMPALGRLSGFDSDDVKVKFMSFDAKLPALLSGKIDFTTAWYGSGYASFLAAAAEQGVTLDFIQWSDFGLDVYGQCLVASEDFVAGGDDRVNALIGALRTSFERAIDNPEGAIEASAEANPDSEREVIELSWMQAKDLAVDDDDPASEILGIDMDKLERTRSLAAPEVDDAVVERATELS